MKEVLPPLTISRWVLLAFVAAHRFVLAAHLQMWLGTSFAVASRRLVALVDVGLLSYRRIFHAQPG